MTMSGCHRDRVMQCISNKGRCNTFYYLTNLPLNESNIYLCDRLNDTTVGVNCFLAAPNVVYRAGYKLPRVTLGIGLEIGVEIGVLGKLYAVYTHTYIHAYIHTYIHTHPNTHNI